MPIIEVPNYGQVEFPDDMTDEQIVSAIKKNALGYKQSEKPIAIGKDAFPDALRETLRETDWGTRNIAGAGTALSNLWEGAKQFVGKGNQQNIENNRIIEEEAPVGALAGNVALTAVPFAKAGSGLKAAAGVGAGFGALQPVSGDQGFGNVVRGKGLSTIIGGASGLAGQAVANKAGDWIANKAAEVVAKRSANAPIDATIKEAIEAGYVIPPGNVKPSFLNRQLESMGGKIATQQMAASRNQEITDTLARKAAGLAENQPITPDSLMAVRSNLGKAYDDVGSIVGNDTVETLKTLRADANDLWKMQQRNPHPETLALAKQKSADAENLEKTIDQVLSAAGKKDVMSSFRDARRKIAINHEVENALIEGGGTIDARAIARSTQKGKPLTGELATIGNFANNFPRITQPDKMVGTPDAHNLKYMLSLAMGGGGYAAGNDPSYAALGLLPLLSGPAARSLMLRKGAQKALANPVYQIPVASRVTGGLLQYAPSGLAALGATSLD